MTIEFGNIEQSEMKIESRHTPKFVLFFVAIIFLLILCIGECGYTLSAAAKDEPIVQKLKYNSEVCSFVGQGFERLALFSQFCSKSDVECSPTQRQGQFLINGSKGTARVDYVVNNKDNTIVYLQVKGLWGINGNMLIVDDLYRTDLLTSIE